MTDLLMLDTVDVSTLSGLRFDALAGYVGGSWPTFSPECKAYPELAKKGLILSYAVNASEQAEALDCETGDASVAQVPGWLDAALKRGVKRPAVYANLDRWENQGLKSLIDHFGQSIRRIVADWTYRPGIDFSWADAQQWSDHYASRNIDGNTVRSDFFVAGQPPHHNPIDYSKFDTKERVTHWGKLSERGVVERYDAARPTESKHAREVQIYEAQLGWFAARVKCEAGYGDPLPNGKFSWLKDNRGWRYQQLIRRSHGQQFH